MKIKKLPLARAVAALCMATSAPFVAADITVTDRGFVVDDTAILLNGIPLGPPPATANPTSTADISSASTQVLLNPLDPLFGGFGNPDASLTVNGGSTLTLGGRTSELRGLPESGAIVSRVDAIGSPTDTFKTDINVDGGNIVITADTGTGSIILDGRSDLNITNGGSVQIAGSNGCTGAFNSCDVLIGRYRTSSLEQTNSGVLIDGAGSLLDTTAGTTASGGGEVIVGGLPGNFNSGDPNTDGDFFAVLNEGEARTGNVAIGRAEEAPDFGVTSGEVRGSAIVDNATWTIEGPSNGAATLNIGEEDGAGVAGRGNLIIQNGGSVSINAAPGQEGDFGIGQTLDGQASNGSNLLIVSGAGSSLTADGDSTEFAGSRIANANVLIEDGGSVVLDGGGLAITGNSGAALDSFNSDFATSQGYTVDSTYTLDVRSGGSLELTDDPGAGNDFIYIGSVDLPGIDDLTSPEDVAVRVQDASITAREIIVGLSDYEGAAIGAGAGAASLVLDNGIINGDVIIDDFGSLSGTGTINGTLFAEGGTIAPGFSPGTLTVEEFILGAGTLLFEIGVNDSGIIDPLQSDRIVSSAGVIDLSGGNVVFQLVDSDGGNSVEDSLGAAPPPLNIGDLFATTSGDPIVPTSNPMTRFQVSGLSGGAQFAIGDTVVAAQRFAVPAPATVLLFAVGLLALRRRAQQRV